MSAPSRFVCDQVDKRDEWRCQRCGVSLTTTSGSRHHRQRRTVGGHTTDVLILLCGSGTTGCHGWVHANPMKARAVGLIVPTWVTSVSEVPVRCFDGRWWLFDPMGGRKRILEALALELLAAFGMLAPEMEGV